MNTAHGCAFTLEKGAVLEQYPTYLKGLGGRSLMLSISNGLQEISPMKIAIVLAR